MNIKKEQKERTERKNIKTDINKDRLIKRERMKRKTEPVDDNNPNVRRRLQESVFEKI